MDTTKPAGPSKEQAIASQLPAENAPSQGPEIGHLKEELQKYRDMFDNAPIGIVQSDVDGRLLGSNLAAARILGYDSPQDNLASVENIARDLYVDPDRRQKLIDLSRDRNQLRGFETRFRRKDGRAITCKLFVRVVRTADGAVDYLESFIEDITEIRKTEKALKESEALYRSLFENTGAGTIIIEEDTTISFANSGFEKIIGYSKAEIEGKMKWTAVIAEPAELAMMLKYHRKRRLLKEAVPIEYEFKVRDKKGKKKNIFLRVDMIAGTKRSVASLIDITSIVDIHERQLAKDRIREQENRLKKENVRLRKTIRDRYKFGSIVGKSAAMQEVYELILRAAATDANVIIYGESGTGKELVAKAIHDFSDRSVHAFVPVNCAAIPRHLVESEFFGYKKGAFSGALADKPGYLDKARKGSLFLDELGDVQPEMQVKLLRVLGGSGYTPVGSVNVRGIDCRIIAATNRNVRKLLENGQLREDFFYRIHIIPIQLPPLRERKEDIPLLAEHFMKKYKKKNEPITPLGGKIMDALHDYDWPGNVRELENSMQRLINLGHLDFHLAPSGPLAGSLSPLEDDMGVFDRPLRQAVSSFEKRYITGVLEKYKWNRTRAAEHLGVERKTLYLKMKNFGIQ